MTASRPSLLIILTLLPLNALSEDKNIQEARSCIDQLRHVESNVKDGTAQAFVCNLPPSASFPDQLNEHMGPANKSPAHYFSRASCSEIFSDSPPRWMPKEIGKNGRWRPVCSMFRIQAIRQDSPSKVLTPLELENERIRAVQNGEQCASSAARSAPTIDPPPNAPASISARKKRELSQTFNSLRTHISKICCYDKHAACLERLENLPLSWCEYKNGEWSPGSCKNSLLFYQTSRSYRSSYPIVGKSSPYTLTNDELALIYARPNLKDSKSNDDQWAGQVLSIVHELGHACSVIRRKIMMFDKDKQPLPDHAYLMEWVNEALNFDENGVPTEKCVITPLSKSIYQSLFRGFGANRETFECVHGLAQKAPQITSLGKTCVPCPLSYLEESFAEWMKISMTPKKHRGYDLIESECTSLRDPAHPAAQDLLGCFLKTDSIRRLLKQDLKCL